MNKLIGAVGAMLGGIALLGLLASTATAQPARTRDLTIVHVTRGCHNWSFAGKQSAQLRVSLRRGDALRITNNDIDMHVLVRKSGPALGADAWPLMRHAITVVFRTPGTYTFGTRVQEMPGMPEVETGGPDHVLRLIVTVA